MNKEQIKAETLSYYRRKSEFGTGVYSHVGMDDNEDYLFTALVGTRKPFVVRKVDVAKEYDKLDTFDLDSIELTICPRLEGTPLQDQEMQWLVNENGDKTCSGCGSWHPQQYIDWLETAADPKTKDTLETSTKSYKHYIKREGITNAGDGAIKMYMQHLSQYVHGRGSNINVLEIEEKINKAIKAGKMKPLHIV